MSPGGLQNPELMKKHLFLWMTLLAAGTLSAQNRNDNMDLQHRIPQEGRGNARVAYLGQSIDRMVYEFMEEEGIPGLTLAIVQAPYIPRVVGYGVTDIREGRLAAVRTLWPAGPISQGFAAVAVIQLHELGKLSLDDKASKYLKGLPAAWNGITIRQLLQHSAGLPDYRDRPGFDVSASYTPAGLIASVAGLPLEFTPGTDVRQSATNFLLLAEVVEKVSGKSYRDFVKKNQIDRLGLRQTFFAADLAGVKQEDVAATNHRHELFKHDPAYINPAETTVGYVMQEGRLVEAAPVGPSLKGFSDIWASAENISHWDIGLAGGVLIAKPENRALIYAPTKLDNGRTIPAMAGWQFYAHPGLMDIKGGVSGHSVFLSRFTDASELVCVTLMANREGVDFTNLARRIAAAFDNDKLASGADDNRLYTYESSFGVDETMDRVEAQLKALDIPIFARFDHGLNAGEVGLELRPTKVVVFGAPKVGTKLMQDNPSIAIELPLRIAVWEDAAGSVWAAFPQMKQLGAEYGMADSLVIANMQRLLETIVRKSANIY